MSYDINAIESINNDEHDHLSKKMRVSNETYLWHLRLGHINLIGYKIWLKLKF